MNQRDFGHAGIVEHDVEAAVGIDRELDRRLNRLGIGGVHFDENGTTAGGFDFFGDGLCARAAQIGDHDSGAFLSEAAHSSGADTGTASSYDSHSTIKFTGHNYPLGKPSTRSPMMLC